MANTAIRILNASMEEPLTERKPRAKTTLEHPGQH